MSESMVGKIVTYPGRSNMFNPVWRLEAGIVVKETAKMVKTKTIVGSITSVNKHHIFGVHDIKDKKKVIEVCKRTLDIYKSINEEITKKKRWAQEAIEGIANGYEI